MKFQKLIKSLALVLTFIIVFSFSLVLFTKYPKRTLAKAASMSINNINNLSLLINAKSPILKSELFDLTRNNDRTMTIESLLRDKYGLAKDFKYSLFGILLQNNKKLFSIIKDSPRFYICQSFETINRDVKYNIIPMVIARPKNTPTSIIDNNMVFPIGLGSCKLYLSNINYKGESLLNLLKIDDNGKFKSLDAENKFLEVLEKLKKNM